MDRSNQKGGKTFTADEVRHYLGLDNDYDDDCSTSSSDSNCEEDSTLPLDSTSSSPSDIDLNQSDNETIIPPSPKRIKSDNSKRKTGKIVRNTCILADVSSTCRKQEHGKLSCTAQSECTTSGTNLSPVTLHTTQDTYMFIPAAETHTHFNSTGNHDKQNVVLVHDIQPTTQPTNTVRDTSIQEQDSTCISTEQSNLTDDHNTSLQLQQVPEPVFTIQLDIPSINEESIVTDNTSQINLPAQEAVPNQYSVPVPSQPPQHRTTVNDNPPENETILPPESPPQFDRTNYISDIEDHDQYYEVEIEPTPPDITDLCTPITNFSRDEVNEGDVVNGWEKIEPDIIPDYGPFTGIQGINMDGNSREPEDFFNNLLEERMFTIMADETNNYARRKIRELMAGRDHAQQMDHYSHRQHARLGQWKDLNPSDMKIFTAHLLIMSSVHKPALHNYWSTNTLSRTPFFGQYIGRNKFQEILWNLHVSDSTNNPPPPPPGAPNHDPLAKVRPLLEMCQTNFKLRYTPGQHISLDESTMAFKGRVR